MKGIEEGNLAKGAKRPPADDAPIEDLVDYWTRRKAGNASTELPEPTETVRERLLGAAEKKPWLLPNLYDFLPENSGTHDRLYRVLTEQAEFDDDSWTTSLYWWLQSNTQYLRSELIEAVRTRDNNDPDKLDELEALAKLEWSTAKPLLENIVAEGMSGSTPMALSLLYEGAVKNLDTTEAETYRALLKKMIVERDLSLNVRRKALESLLKDDWIGQEEWYLSLFSQPTVWGLQELRTRARMARMNDMIAGAGSRSSSSSGNFSPSLASMGNSSFFSRPDMNFLSTALKLNPARWIPVVTKLIASDDPVVREGAVSALSEVVRQENVEKKDRENAARPLLPWLTNPDWVSIPGRTDFIGRLAELDLPESVADLLWILDHDRGPDNLEAAITALLHYCNSRTAPVLKRVLEREPNRNVRIYLATALVKCGGLSDDEMAAAIEAYAGMLDRGEVKITIEELVSGNIEKSLPSNVIVGDCLYHSDLGWATEGFAAALFERVKELRRTRPEVANRILYKIRHLPLRIARGKLIERLDEGTANLVDLKLALTIRDLLEENWPKELEALVKKGGSPSGIAVVILKDRRKQLEILKGKDLTAQIALLASARYRSDKLPIELLRDMLLKADKPLMAAIQSYLAAEGSVAARKLLLAQNPNELRILGDIDCLAEYQRELGELKAWEENLRKEMLAPNGVEEIYAFAPAVPSKRLKSIVIRVREGKAESSVYDLPERRKIRTLTESELRELKDFTSRPGFEDLGPESRRIHKPTLPHEYLHLTKEGGRRIILETFGRAPKSPSLHEELSSLFYQISTSGEYK